ncbi:hypothetical protein EXIGLDRAFT_788635, partial [Exidia glandulosa HHB12029]
MSGAVSTQCEADEWVGKQGPLYAREVKVEKGTGESLQERHCHRRPSRTLIDPSAKAEVKCPGLRTPVQTIFVDTKDSDNGYMAAALFSKMVPSTSPVLQRGREYKTLELRLKSPQARNFRGYERSPQPNSRWMGCPARPKLGLETMRWFCRTLDVEGSSTVIRETDLDSHSDPFSAISPDIKQKFPRHLRLGTQGRHRRVLPVETASVMKSPQYSGPRQISSSYQQGSETMWGERSSCIDFDEGKRPTKQFDPVVTLRSKPRARGLDPGESCQLLESQGKVRESAVTESATSLAQPPATSSVSSGSSNGRNMEGILDFSTDLDVTLLDKVAIAFFSGAGQEQQNAQRV